MRQYPLVLGEMMGRKIEILIFLSPDQPLTALKIRINTGYVSL